MGVISVLIASVVSVICLCIQRALTSLCESNKKKNDEVVLQSLS